MKAYNLNKTLLSSVLLATFCSGTALADSVVGSLDFRTVPDVSIIQLRPLDFGGGLQLASGSVCNLAVDGTARPSGALGRVDSIVGDAAGYELKSGDCTAEKGQVGIYNITGASGVEVNITVNGILDNVNVDFGFTPQAMASDYEGTGGVDSFSLMTTDVVEKTAIGTATLAAAGDNTFSAVAGQTRLFVGGALEVQRQLTAGTTYDQQQFVIDVTY
jgi:hypothetical protein